MPRVLIDDYSSFFDHTTNVQFSPVLDRRQGAYVGIAEVSAKVAKEYAKRPKFRVITDAEFLAMTSVPAQPEPDEPEADDPLEASAGAPPPPPPGETAPETPAEPAAPADEPPAPPASGDRVLSDGDGATAGEK